jgi:hypothetical protein
MNRNLTREVYAGQVRSCIFGFRSLCTLVKYAQLLKLHVRPHA